MSGLPDTAAKIVSDALREDGAAADVTTAFLRLAGTSIEALFIARAAGYVAGLDVARLVFSTLDPHVEFEAHVAEGDRVAANDIIAVVKGDAGAVLPGERVALNFLQRLSGIATLTARFVHEISDSGVTILDTRKTTPLLRSLEKYAVTVGGGSNHRFNLTDMMLIKENHLRSVGGLAQVAARMADKPDMRVELEVDSLAMLGEALALNVDRIMLDNFTPDQVRKALSRIGDHPVEIEVSGGVTLDNISEYAIDGVDFISIGALTHAAPWLDISLEVRSHDD